MLMLFSEKTMGDMKQSLLAYEGALEDVTAYNGVVLKMPSPSTFPLPQADRDSFTQYTQEARSNSNLWMETIVRRCRSIPANISGIDMLFKQDFKFVNRSLNELLGSPDDKAIKEALKKTLDSMCEIMDKYQKNIVSTVDYINQYHDGVAGNAKNIVEISTKVKNQQKVDEGKKREIQGKILEATAKLEEASAKVSADESLLRKKKFILVSVLGFGIPFFVVSIDLAVAKQTIREEKNLLDLYGDTLSDEAHNIAVLSAAETVYTNLQARITALTKSFGSIISVWQSFKDDCQRFIGTITDEEKHVSADEIKEALDNMKVTSARWDALKTLSDELMNVKYDLVTDENDVMVIMAG